MNKEFVEELIKEGNPFAIYIYQTGCTYCNEISPLLTHKLPKGKYNSKEVPLYKVNGQNQRELMDMLDLRSYPSIFIIKGTTFIRLEGLKEIKSYING